MIAASIMKDDILVDWIRHVTDARCSKRYTPEYHRLLPVGDGQRPWLWFFAEHKISQQASTAIAKIEQESRRREQWIESKI